MSSLKHQGQTVQTVKDGWQTQARGSNSNEYQIYLSFANDGQGGDVTRNGAPLKTYDEWLKS